MAGKEIPFYNIDSAVGPACPNKRTDVALVQFFLQQIFGHPTKKDAQPPGEKIKVTGTFDATTGTWIRHYQGHLKQKRHSFHVDGRIDRAKGEQLSKSSISHTIYTIAHLNIDHCVRFRQEHNHLERHPLLPGDVKAEFQKGEPQF